MMWGMVASWIVGKDGWKWIVAGLAALAIAGTIFAGHQAFTSMQERLEQLSADNARLLDASKLAQERGEALRNHIDRIALEQAENAAALRDIARRSQEARREVKDLAALFSKHDLRRLLDADTGRPGLLERRINDASERTRRMLERASDLADHDGTGAGSSEDRNTGAAAP